MSKKPKKRIVSWKSLVDKVNPERRKPKVVYRFSNGRKFYDK